MSKLSEWKSYLKLEDKVICFTKKKNSIALYEKLLDSKSIFLDTSNDTSKGRQMLISREMNHVAAILERWPIFMSVERRQFNDKMKESKKNDNEYVNILVSWAHPASWCWVGKLCPVPKRQLHGARAFWSGALLPPYPPRRFRSRRYGTAAEAFRKQVGRDPLGSRRRRGPALRRRAGGKVEFVSWLPSAQQR